MTDGHPVNLRPVQNRDLEIKVEAETIGTVTGQKKMATATLIQYLPDGELAGPKHLLVSDEGSYLGGENSAPFPLAYFVSGVAF